MIGVSVIVPAYNAENTIKETIDSILNQSNINKYNIEVIVVDDGSTDHTLHICETFGDKLILIRQDNKGVSFARNKAASIAKYEWLAFLDSDDIWLPNKLDLQFTEMAGYDWSITDSFYFGYKQDGTVKRSDLTKVMPEPSFNSLLSENFITTSTVIIKKEIFMKNGGFDVNLPALEDWDLWLKVLHETAIKYIPYPLAKYRITPGSTSRKSRTILPLHFMLIKKFKKTYNIDLLVFLKCLSNSALICSYIAEDACDRTHTLHCSILSFFCYPFSLNKLKRLISSIIFFLRNNRN